MTVQVATEAGMVMGTVGYMSPEQVRGKPAVPESDIFAFGAILYEMVSGKRAFHRDSAADTMSAILHEDPPELTETARNVPIGLERIVRHCLEKNPAQRFHSAGDLAFDLEAMADITSSKSGCRPRRNKSGRTTRVASWRSARLAVALAAAMLGVGWWVGRGSANVASSRVSANHLSHRLHRQCPLHPGRQRGVTRPRGMAARANCISRAPMNTVHASSA